MNDSTILYEAAKLHYGEIMKETASWRMANQANINRPVLTRRFVMASQVFLKKLVVRKMMRVRF